MFYKEFEEVKIIPSLITYILLNFIAVIISFLIYKDNYNEALNLLQLIVDTLFIFFLLFSFKASIAKLKNLIKDFLIKVKIKEVVNVLFTQLCFSTGTTFLIISIFYLINIDKANNLLNESNNIVNNTLISFLITVIVAPILEELFFRAICFKRIAKFFNVYIGIIASSIFFGVLHIELAILGAILFGAANCILYIKYKNILIPILIHFLNNLIASLPNILSPTHSPNLVTHSDIIAYLLTGTMLSAVGLLLFFRFFRINQRYLS